jgi:hypothetical protein
MGVVCLLEDGASQGAARESFGVDAHANYWGRAGDGPLFFTCWREAGLMQLGANAEGAGTEGRKKLTGADCILF